MNTYKLSANTKEEIIEFIKIVYDFDWDGFQTPISINQNTLVYLDKIILSYDLDENNLAINIIYLDGFHFDLLTDKDLFFTEQKDENDNILDIFYYSNITQHFPLEPKHKFA
jgi:hypothetical protein